MIVLIDRRTILATRSGCTLFSAGRIVLFHSSRRAAKCHLYLDRRN